MDKQYLKEIAFENALYEKIITKNNKIITLLAELEKEKNKNKENGEEA